MSRHLISRGSALRSLRTATYSVGLAVAAGALASALTPVLPSSPTAELAKGTAPQADADAILGAELVIDGFVISHAEIKRAVVTGSVGVTTVEMAKLRTLIRQEIERRVKEGDDAGAYEVTDEEVQSTIKEHEAQVKEDYADENLKVEELVDGGLEGLSSHVQLTKVFNKTFLPQINPEDYPAITVQALKNSETGDAMLGQLQREWNTNPDHPELSRQNPMYQQILFNTIYEYLQDTSDIETGSSLPVGVAMRINDDEITVDELWTRIKDKVSSSDVRRAKKWLVNLHLLKNALGDEWLSDEEAAAEFKAHAEPYDASMFTMKNFALGVKKFPNMDHYQEYRRAYDSFQRHINDDLNPETLMAFADTRTRQLIGKTKVDTDVILVSAYDFKTHSWKEDGWKRAAQRTREVLRLLGEEKRPWDEVLEEYSDFYDPPTPANFTGTTTWMKFKGRFRNVGRNQLMQKLDESEFSQFLNGGLLSDQIFFDLKEGTLGDPVRGRYGYYIPLLRKRTVVPLVSTNEESIIIMAEQDYTQTKLSGFVQSLVAASDVKGLDG